MEDSPTAKEQTIYWLRCLIELVENDRIHTEKIRGMTSAQVIELAEAEAAKAITGSADLANKA